MQNSDLLSHGKSEAEYFSEAHGNPMSAGRCLKPLTLIQGFVVYLDTFHVGLHLVGLVPKFSCLVVPSIQQPYLCCEPTLFCCSFDKHRTEAAKLSKMFKSII